MSTNTSRKGRPLKAAAEKLDCRTEVNLTRSEYNRVMADYDQTVYPTKTSYFRARVVDRSIQKRAINANLEQLEHALVTTNEELIRIGVNINQLTKHLNTYKAAARQSEVLALLKLFVAVQEKTDAIQHTIHEIHEQW